MAKAVLGGVLGSAFYYRVRQENKEEEREEEGEEEREEDESEEGEEEECEFFLKIQRALLIRCSLTYFKHLTNRV